MERANKPICEFVGCYEPAVHILMPEVNRFYACKSHSAQVRDLINLPYINLEIPESIKRAVTNNDLY
jgi:hypothetical protein